MPSWDKSSSGGSGGDEPKQPEPSPSPSYNPYSVYPPPARGREQADGTRPDDTTRETGNSADENANRNGYDAVFERQDKLIEGQEQQIGRLFSDLGKRDAEIARLKAENDRQAEIIELLESGDEVDSPDDPGGGDAPSRLAAPDRNAKKIEQLEDEIAEGSAERRDLVGIIAGQSKTIRRLESEVESLKAKLAGADAGKRRAGLLRR